jgi:hypothetical protein
MKISPEQLATNILAAISRELHMADVPHEQGSISVTVHGVPTGAVDGEWESCEGGYQVCRIGKYIGLRCTLFAVDETPSPF